MSKMKVTFLGTGSSTGQPVLGCNCDVCNSNDLKDSRLRTAAMIDIDETRIIIDAGYDFRQQLLKFNRELRIDAILLTHEHRDHVAGLEEVKPVTFFRKKSVPIYATKYVLKDIKELFFYCFNDYYKTKIFDLHEITLSPFFINNIKIIPIRAKHGDGETLAFRINDFTYITDAKHIDNEEINKIRGTKILVVNALRYSKHYSHFNLDEALELINEIKPLKAYLTHISHQFGKYEDLLKILPENVEPAYDGLMLEI